MNSFSIIQRDRLGPAHRKDAHGFTPTRHSIAEDIIVKREIVATLVPCYTRLALEEGLEMRKGLAERHVEVAVHVVKDSSLPPPIELGAELVQMWEGVALKELSSASAAGWDHLRRGCISPRASAHVLGVQSA
jgi:hypothetical protein